MQREAKLRSGEEFTLQTGVAEDGFLEEVLPKEEEGLDGRKEAVVGMSLLLLGAYI